MSACPPPADAGFFARHSVRELAAALRSGQASAGELVRHVLDEATRLDRLNAFVTVDAEGAAAAAQQADRELAAGHDRGPLHGIPFAVKDVIATAGLRTTMGSRHFADHVPDHDAACVQQLREAGAVIVAKSTTHEFAYGPTGDRSANGAARNPHQPEHIAGGSSGGSATAVAAGIVPLALGTDTGGSVRIPAACCGVVGLRPTEDSVSTDGVFPLTPSLDTVGPIARTPADCALAWTALAPTHPVSGAPERLPVGWVPPESLHPVDAAVTSIARTMLDRLEGDATVAEAALPDAATIGRTYAALQGRAVAALHAERLATAPDLYDEEVLARLRGAERVTEAEYEQAREAQRRGRQSVAALWRRFAMLALPTIPIPAPPLGASTVQLTGQSADVRDALLALTSPWSVLGLPALSVPAGFVDGLPVGLQLVGPPGAEGLLLTVAERLDATERTHHTPSQPHC